MQICTKSDNAGFFSFLFPREPKLEKGRREVNEAMWYGQSQLTLHKILCTLTYVITNKSDIFTISLWSTSKFQEKNCSHSPTSNMWIKYTKAIWHSSLCIKVYREVTNNVDQLKVFKMESPIFATSNTFVCDLKLKQGGKLFCCTSWQHNYEREHYEFSSWFYSIRGVNWWRK